MDSKTLAETEKNLAGIKAPNESRLRLNLPPVEGGESPMTQQQNYSLAALAKRDAKPDPFATGAPSQPAGGADDEDEVEDDEQSLDEDATAQLASWLLRSSLLASYGTPR